MKPFVTSLALLSIACTAGAQDGIQDGNKLTVPLSSPGQPATLKLSIVTGKVTITGSASTQQVTVTSSGSNGFLRGRHRDVPPPPGMHRIDIGENSTVVEDHNVVTIKPGGWGGDAHNDVQTPVNTNVIVKAVNCDQISVVGITGDLEVECTNGSLDLTDVSGTVVAHTVNGKINVTMDKVTPDKPMSFTSLNGKINVTLPADTKARLRIKTANGSVFTDFDVKMEANRDQPALEDSHGQSNGKYRIRMNRGVYGSINGGGPEYSFQTMNGEILIHKK